MASSRATDDSQAEGCKLREDGKCVFDDNNTMKCYEAVITSDEFTPKISKGRKLKPLPGYDPTTTTTVRAKYVVGIRVMRLFKEKTFRLKSP